MSKLLMCLNQAHSKKLCPLLQQNGFEVTSTSELSFALKLFDEGDFFLILVENTPLFIQAFSQKLQKNPKMNGVLLVTQSTQDTCPFKSGFIGHFDGLKTAPLLYFLTHYRRFYEHQMQKVSFLSRSPQVHPFIFKSPSMLAILDKVEKVAKTHSSVLITGESGTGKEVIARLIHEKSLRYQHPFVALNCAAIAPNLLESELFGYEKGAFTGATNRKIGRFEYADQGSFFLDEITEMPLELQAKLLRVLQEREFERVGGLEPIKVNLRILAASNQNLQKAIEEKKFREDLYYRLSVVPIHLPPLRERKEDILALAYGFLEKFAKQNGKSIPHLTEEAQKVLLNYPWPGNVRELSNLMERTLVLLNDSVIDPSDLHLDMPQKIVVSPQSLDLESLETQAITDALKATCGNKTQAAKLLGLSLKTLRSKLNKIQTV